MTLSYPLEFPDQPFEAARCRFHFETFGTMSRTQGGEITFQEHIGGSLWEASYTTKPLNERNYGRWHAFALGLRGNGTFMGYDPRRCYPIAYGISTPVTAPTITAAGGKTISVSGFTNGFQLIAGDYISFPWRGTQALVKFVESVTFGAGGNAVIEIAPALLADGSVPVAGTLVKPWCYMKIKPGSWQGDRSILDAITFEAIQTVGV
jgi:hypothetical protein